jgi:hypothetical protein
MNNLEGMTILGTLDTKDRRPTNILRYPHELIDHNEIFMSPMAKDLFSLT